MDIIDKLTRLRYKILRNSTLMKLIVSKTRCIFILQQEFFKKIQKMKEAHTLGMSVDFDQSGN